MGACAVSMTASGSYHDLYSFSTNHYDIAVRVLRKLTVKARSRERRDSYSFVSSRDILSNVLDARLYKWTQIISECFFGFIFFCRYFGVTAFRLVTLAEVEVGVNVGNVCPWYHTHRLRPFYCVRDRSLISRSRIFAFSRLLGETVS